MKLQTKIFIGVIVVLLIIGGVTFKAWQKEKAEAKRQASNVENLTRNLDQVNMELDLKRGEYEKMDTWWKRYLDSVNQKHEIALKEVKSATIIDIQYKDTGSVKIVYLPPKKVDAYTYMVPVSYRDSCWGMDGYILSQDSTSTFELTERTARNKAALEVTRKRFLGFLWWTRKTRFQAFTDCGEIEFVKIDFKK